MNHQQSDQTRLLLGKFIGIQTKDVENRHVTQFQTGVASRYIRGKVAQSRSYIPAWLYEMIAAHRQKNRKSMVVACLSTVSAAVTTTANIIVACVSLFRCVLYKRVCPSVVPSVCPSVNIKTKNAKIVQNHQEMNHIHDIHRYSNKINT